LKFFRLLFNVFYRKTAETLAKLGQEKSGTEHQIAHCFVKSLPQTMNHPQKKTVFERGSSNIFADL
jgi:hypothetical protein